MVFCLHTCTHMDMCQAVQLIARMVKSGGYKAKPAVSVLYVKVGMTKDHMTTTIA